MILPFVSELQKGGASFSNCNQRRGLGSVHQDFLTIKRALAVRYFGKNRDNRYGL